MVGRGGGGQLLAKAGDHTRGASGWNGAAWAGRGSVAVGPLPRARPSEQCRFQIISTKSDGFNQKMDFLNSKKIK
jgi:hypothetical protein